MLSWQELVLPQTGPHRQGTCTGCLKELGTMVGKDLPHVQGEDLDCLIPMIPSVFLQRWEDDMKDHLHIPLDQTLDVVVVPQGECPLCHLIKIMDQRLN